MEDNIEDYHSLFLVKIPNFLIINVGLEAKDGKSKQLNGDRYREKYLTCLGL